MSGASHTPGPWAVSKNSSGRRVTSTTGIVICNAVIRNCGTAKSGIKRGAKDVLEAEANARLIASAPELLDACETNRLALIAIADSALEAGFDGLANIIDSELAKVNVAIAKARGQ